jgi:hypothetical protein
MAPWLAAVAMGLGVFALLAALDQFAKSIALVSGMKLVMDAGIAALCGCLVFHLMENGRQHEQVVQRLQLIRSALDHIQTSADACRDPEFVENIRIAVARIEWSLREFPPEAGGTSKSHEETDHRAAGYESLPTNVISFTETGHP